MRASVSVRAKLRGDGIYIHWREAAPSVDDIHREIVPIGQGLRVVSAGTDERGLLRARGVVPVARGRGVDRARSCRARA